MKPWWVLRGAAVALLLVTFVTGAVAQEDAPAGEPEREVLLDADAEAQAEATSSEPDGAIEEMRVTITKREENIQDIAGSVSAITGEQIQEANIESLSDYVSLLPNVQIKGEGNAAITIRGISRSFTSQSPVSQHMNGVFLADPNYLGGQFYDLEGIEVKRGPSGTLYGRNATAGAINVKWRRPHSAYEVFGDYTRANFDSNQFRGGVNLPFLGEGDQRLMGRFVVQREKRDGYLDNLLEPRNRDPGNADRWSGRGTLRSILMDGDVEVQVRGHWTRSKGGDAVSKPFFTDDFPIGLQDAGPIGAVPLDLYDGYELTEARLPDILFPITRQGFVDGVVASLTPPLTPTFFFNTLLPGQILATTGNNFFGDPDGAIEYAVRNGVPAFGLFPAIPNSIDIAIDQTVAGFNIDLDTPPARRIPSNPRDVVSRAYDIEEPNLEAYGLDGDLTWNLHDVGFLGDMDFKVLGGWQRRKFDQVSDADGTELFILDNYQLGKLDSFTAEVNLSSNNPDEHYAWLLGFFFFNREENRNDLTLTPFGPFPTSIHEESSGYAPFISGELRICDLFAEHMGWEDPLDVTIFGGVRWNIDKIERLEINEEVAIRPASMLNGREKFRARTGEVGAKWFLTPDNQVYFTWARGYKAGQLQLLQSSGEALGVDPEEIEAWELGTKNTFFDGKLQLNLTGFYYEYTDLQVPQILGIQVVTRNAAEATVWGIEFEGVWQPTPEWTSTVSVGYLDATFDEFCNDDAFDFTRNSEPGCPDPRPGSLFNGQKNLKGNQLEDSPRWTISLLSRYEIDLGQNGTITPVVEFTYTDQYFLRPNNRSIDRVGAYTKTDLRIIWRSPERRWSVEAFVENLEDNTIYARRIVGPEFTGPSVTGFGLLPPRVYGVRVGFNWGGAE